jgi:Fis family transcriptional regulator
MTVTNHEFTTQTFSVIPLRTQVRSALQHYFIHLEGDMPSNLYKLVLQEVECPLLEIVMDQARGNQTKAAEILGINRSTLRKKLKQYGIDE